MDLRFVTKNKFKVDEVQKLLTSINVIHCPIEIKEIQTESIDEIVNDKVLKAFNKIGRPLFIEHTSLYLGGMNGFPGGLTQIFWDKLQADKFSEIVSKMSDQTVEAKTVIGYCTGKKIYKFEGVIKGKISDLPKGSKDFQWDCVFIPDGYSQTFAEMGEQKNIISMRKIAFDKFYDFLKDKR